MFRADAFAIGIQEDQFWGLTPREISAYQKAHVSLQRLIWSPLSAAAALHFESQRDPKERKSRGVQFTAEMFSLPDPHGNPVAKEHPNTRIIQMRVIAMANGEDDQVPAWAKNAVVRAKERKKHGIRTNR